MLSGVIGAAALPVSGLCLPKRLDRHTVGRQNKKFVHMLDRSINAGIRHACTLNLHHFTKRCSLCVNLHWQQCAELGPRESSHEVCIAPAITADGLLMEAARA